jgi:hypothetical protein
MSVRGAATQKVPAEAAGVGGCGLAPAGEAATERRPR